MDKNSIKRIYEHKTQYKTIDGSCDDVYGSVCHGN